MIPQYWHNWAYNQEAVAHYHAPRSREALQDVVRDAARRGRVRTIGRSYAWSPLIPTRDTLVDMRHLDQPLAVGTDSAGNPTITTQSGISMEALTRFAASHGLTLISPTIFPKVSIGGVLSTGSHGTGREVQTFSDAVVSLDVVAPDGSLVTLGPGHPMLQAAKVGLGCFGPIYSVTLRAERAFNVRTEERRFPVDVMLRGLVDAVRSYEFVEHYWFPFARDMWLMAIDRTDEPRDRPTIPQVIKKGVDWALTMASAYAVIPLISRKAPQLTPAMMKIAPGFAFKQGVTVEPSKLQFHYVTAYPRNFDMSYAVPLDKAALAWRLGIDLVESYRAEGRYPCNFVLHARYIRSSDALLSPANLGGGHVCMIEVVTGIGTPERDEFFARMAALWRDQCQGRPHWGKMMYRPETLKGDYGANMDDFLVQREAFDPNRRFLNPWLERDVFQLPP